MKEKQILFSGEMVRAILNRRKTQTRIVIKGKDGKFIKEFFDGVEDYRQCLDSEKGVRIWLGEYPEEGSELIKCPYGYIGNYLKFKMELKDQEQCPCCGYTNHDMQIQMDHHLCRVNYLKLKIIDIRIERLNDITAEDAVSEGITPSTQAMDRYSTVYSDYAFPRTAFLHLWESIYGAGSWEKNPWVWVIKFIKK